MNQSVPPWLEWVLIIAIGFVAAGTFGFIVYKIYEVIRFIYLKISKWTKKTK